MVIRDWCSYCGKPLTQDNFEIDHFVPSKHGGTSESDNLIPACRSCNRSKGSKPFILWLATRTRNSIEKYWARVGSHCSEYSRIEHVRGMAHTWKVKRIASV